MVKTVELALAAAYRKDFADKLQNIKVELDPQTGRFRVFDMKEVVADVSERIKEEAERLARQKKKASLYMGEGQFDEGEIPLEDIDLTDEDKLIEEGKVLLKFNPRTQITLTDAKKKQKSLELGGLYQEELEVPHDFGRMAAQTAKQVIIQRIREAERETVFNEFKSKEGEMVSGVIQRVEGSMVMVDIGRVNAVLPQREQIPHERYRIGQRIKVILVSVAMTPKGPEVIVSRTHRDLVKKLFELEVPELESGTVELKAVAREAGSRSKIAVVAHEENIDPIGSCVGQRGSRVTAVIDELGGEKIDIIEWNKEFEKFIASALSPAKVETVTLLDPEEKKARVTVRADQQSLAIGKGGQNVRLAAKLTGWKIDIVQFETGEVVEEAEKEEKKTEASQPSLVEEVSVKQEEVKEEIPQEEAPQEEAPQDEKQEKNEVA